MTTRSIESWVTLLERSFGAVIVGAPVLLVTVFVAIVAALYFSNEDQGPDIRRALGMDESGKLESPAVNAAFRTMFPDGTPAASLDRFVADLRGTCSDIPEAQTRVCAPDATDPACRGLHGIVHTCQVPVSSSICWRTDIWTSAQLAPDRTMTGFRAKLGNSGC